MPRKGPVSRRSIEPDSMYHSTLAAKFIHHIMRKGKKSKAEKIFYTALEILKEKTGEDPLKVFQKAVENVRPQMEVRPRRIGGATYQIPIEVPEYRAVSLSIRWILSAARSRSGHTMEEKLAAELLDAYNQRGTALRKREETHRMAEANRAFAHFRW